jgi:hypothetical protein
MGIHALKVFINERGGDTWGLVERRELEDAARSLDDAPISPQYDSKPAQGIPMSSKHPEPYPSEDASMIEQLRRQLEIEEMKNDLRKEFSAQKQDIYVNNSNAVSQEQNHVQYQEVYQEEPEEDSCGDREICACILLPFGLCFLPYLCD